MAQIETVDVIQSITDKMCSPVAQSVERLAVNQHVRGSSPRWGARIIRGYRFNTVAPFLYKSFYPSVYYFLRKFKDVHIPYLFLSYSILTSIPNLTLTIPGFDSYYQWQ
jgi:hypothetical protein